MSEYDLRSAFPLNGHEFTARDEYWKCRLVEVSDLRPEQDRLSWYLLFQPSTGASGESERENRRLEIVTGAEQILQHHWSPGLQERIADWLATGGDDDRVEWLNG